MPNAKQCPKGRKKTINTKKNAFLSKRKKVFCPSGIRLGVFLRGVDTAQGNILLVLCPHKTILAKVLSL
jgi:hypothetical protein